MQDKADAKRAKKERQKKRKRAEDQAARAAAKARAKEEAEEEDDEEGDDEDDEDEDEDEDEEACGPTRKIACGVQITDLREGNGQPATDRRPCKVHYVGYLPSGEEFERSKSDKPMKFRLGRGEVLKGWDLGVVGMRVGGKRKIVCPATAAYGAQAVKGNPKKGTLDIPPNSELTFIVTLIEAKA